MLVSETAQVTADNKLEADHTVSQLPDEGFVAAFLSMWIWGTAYVIASSTITVITFNLVPKLN